MEERRSIYATLLSVYVTSMIIYTQHNLVTVQFLSIISVCASCSRWIEHQWRTDTILFLFIYSFSLIVQVAEQTRDLFTLVS